MPTHSTPGPEPTDTWLVRYFKRHRDDDPTESKPAQDFLRACPPEVRRRFYSVLIAVAKAPPARFAGGGYWEAMHGEMAGFYEVRVTGAGRRQYRLFCILDAAPPGPDRRPTLAIITGLVKPIAELFTDVDYTRVRALGEEYRGRSPRSWG